MCYSPVRLSLPESRAFDLHVLGTPPAFILSQDQTRHPNLYRISQRRFRCCVSEFSPIDRLKNVLNLMFLTTLQLFRYSGCFRTWYASSVPQRGQVRYYHRICVLSSSFLRIS